MPELTHAEIMEIAREAGKEAAQSVQKTHGYCGFRAIGSQLEEEQVKLIGRFIDRLNSNNVGPTLAALSIAESITAVVKKWIGYVILAGLLVVIMLGVKFVLSLIGKQ